MAIKLYNVKERDVYAQFNVSVKEYVNGTIEVKHYNKEISYKKSGYELIEKPCSFDSNIDLVNKEKKLVNKIQDDNNVIRGDSITRSYKLLVDLALNNSADFKSFITLTFAENVTDIDITNKLFNDWCKKVRYKYKEFMYLCVPEFQKRGSVHYHLLTNLKPGVHFQKMKKLKLWNDRRKCYQEVEYYNIMGWSVESGLGYSSAYDLDLTDNNFSVAAYMSKYFFKDISNRLWGRRKILYSQNLKKPNTKNFMYGTKEYYNYIAYLESRTELIADDDIIPTRNQGIAFKKEIYKER